MKNYTIQLEVNSPFDHLITKQISEAMNTANNKQEAVNLLAYNFSQCKVGAGGNHIWISNQKNEREAIIYLPCK